MNDMLDKLKDLRMKYMAAVGHWASDYIKDEDDNAYSSQTVDLAYMRAYLNAAEQLGDLIWEFESNTGSHSCGVLMEGLKC